MRWKPAPVAAASGPDALVESYRKLAGASHRLLSEQSPDSLLERMADALFELVPYDGLAVYEADERRRLLTPVLARHRRADQIMRSASVFGEGITGWAVDRREPVLSNQAHLDARAQQVPGTAVEPEALISVPLVSRGRLQGALNVYRSGPGASFGAVDFELARSFADAAALALDNAHARQRLERKAQTDSLTGLFNHRHFHERLRVELERACRADEAVTVLMLDIDDFKRVNDVHGHGTGDQVLRELADLLRGAVRGSDVVCRIGGEEFAVIMSSYDATAALGLAERLAERLRATSFGGAGPVTVSTGIAQGPLHAANPRELVSCAEAAMMTAKAAGRNRIAVFGDVEAERPASARTSRDDARSLAHLRMLQSLSGRLNRLSDVRAIGDAIADELAALTGCDACCVSIVEGDAVVPIGSRGPVEHTGAAAGRVAQTGESMLVHGSHPLAGSTIAVALRAGFRVTGAIVVTRPGEHRFDEDDVRLLEVLAGQASVAVENARLHEARRREVERLEVDLAAARARCAELERTLHDAG